MTRRTDTDLDVVIDDYTDGKTAFCPLCKYSVSRFTEAAVVTAIVEHMNQEHPEPKVGRA